MGTEQIVFRYFRQPHLECGDVRDRKPPHCLWSLRHLWSLRQRRKWEA